MAVTQGERYLFVKIKKIKNKKLLDLGYDGRGPHE